MVYFANEFVNGVWPSVTDSSVLTFVLQIPKLVTW